jgi:hypothetical protein
MSTVAPEASTRANTPYLDRQWPLPAPNRNYSKIKRWQIPVLLACLVVKTIAAFYTLLMLVILIHELGHLVIGLIVQDNFQSIRVGVVEFDRFNKLRWKWQWGSLFSGVTLTLPNSTRGIRWRLSLSTLGGPASNLISGFLAFKIASMISPGSNVVVAGALYVFTAESFFVAFVNLVPAVWHGKMNDGMRLFTLAFSRKKSERLISILLFLADVKRGKREAIDKYGTGKWAGVNDQTNEQVIANWAAYRENKDHVEVAAQHLENCLNHSSATTPEFREELIIEAATFQALRRNRIDLARAWLSEDKSGKKHLNRYIAEATILQQEGQTEQALAKIDEALDYVATIPDGARLESAFKKWKVELEEKREDKKAAKAETS